MSDLKAVVWVQSKFERTRHCDLCRLSIDRKSAREDLKSSSTFFKSDCLYIALLLFSIQKRNKTRKKRDVIEIARENCKALLWFHVIKRDLFNEYQSVIDENLNKIKIIVSCIKVQGVSKPRGTDLLVEKKSKTFNIYPTVLLKKMLKYKVLWVILLSAFIWIYQDAKNYRFVFLEDVNPLVVKLKKMPLQVFKIFFNKYLHSYT